MDFFTPELNTFIRDFYTDSKDIPLSEVPFSSEVRKLCEQNMCGNYNKSWTCPPAVDSYEKLQEKLSAFNRFNIVYKYYELEDSFDWEGMMSSAKKFQTGILKLKKLIKKANPESNSLVLGAGTCRLCETCTYEKGDPCRNPEYAITSVEAFGIDAMKMMSDNGLKYNNGQNTVTYIGGIIYHSHE